MTFTNYFFESDGIEQQIAHVTESLKQKDILTVEDVEKYAVGVINRRLTKEPKRYRDYGPYWGALKEVLRRHGHNYGLPVYPLISDVYKGRTDMETIVMADSFRTFYLDTYMIGTNSFVLNDEEPEMYTFVDDDMEELAQ